MEGQSHESKQLTMLLPKVLCGPTMEMHHCLHFKPDLVTGHLCHHFGGLRMKLPGKTREPQDRRDQVLVLSEHLHKALQFCDLSLEEASRPWCWGHAGWAGTVPPGAHLPTVSPRQDLPSHSRVTSHPPPHCRGPGGHLSSDRGQLWPLVAFNLSGRQEWLLDRGCRWVGRTGPGHRGLSSGSAICVTMGTGLLSLDILSHSCRSMRVVPLGPSLWT